MRLRAAVVALALLCAGSAGAVESSAYVLQHVNLLSMVAGEAPLRDATVLIDAGRILAVGPAGTVLVPRGVRVVPAAGKWLMPALADMHIHLENDRLFRLHGKTNLPPGTYRAEDLFLPYIANGVLQVFNLAAMSEAVGQRDAVESGRVLGPHMALAAMIDGDPPVHPVGFTRVAATREVGGQAVREVQAEGYDFVKVYNRLNLETFTAIVDEARQRGMRVVGHIPARGKSITERFFQPGYDLVAHAEEFAQQSVTKSDADVQRYVELLRASGTWLVTTMRTTEKLAEQGRDPSILTNRPEYRYVHPVTYFAWTHGNRYVEKAKATPSWIDAVDAMGDFDRRLVPAVAKAGIPVLAGTDSMLPGVVAGFALHDELERLEAAGLSNEQVLAGATRLPAQWLGVAGDRGTIEPGKRADLLLLDADPTVSVANTRKITAVIVNGRMLSRAWLDAQMNALAKRYAAMRITQAGALVGGMDFECDHEDDGEGASHGHF